MNAVNADGIPCFAFESRDRIVFAWRQAGHQFDCADSEVLGVNGTIDRSHPPFADLANEPVSAIEQLAEHRVGIGGVKENQH